jgi:hypothetical protein
MYLLAGSSLSSDFEQAASHDVEEDVTNKVPQPRSGITTLEHTRERNH